MTTCRTVAIDIIDEASRTITNGIYMPKYNALLDAFADYERKFLPKKNPGERSLRSAVPSSARDAITHIAVNLIDSPDTSIPLEIYSNLLIIEHLNERRCSPFDGKLVPRNCSLHQLFRSHESRLNSVYYFVMLYYYCNKLLTLLTSCESQLINVDDDTEHLLASLAGDPHWTLYRLLTDKERNKVWDAYREQRHDTYDIDYNLQGNLKTIKARMFKLLNDTLATYIDRKGIPRYVCEKVMGHFVTHILSERRFSDELIDSGLKRSREQLRYIPFSPTINFDTFLTIERPQLMAIIPTPTIAPAPITAPAAATGFQILDAMGDDILTNFDTTARESIPDGIFVNVDSKDNNIFPNLTDANISPNMNGNMAFPDLDGMNSTSPTLKLEISISIAPTVSPQSSIFQTQHYTHDLHSPFLSKAPIPTPSNLDLWPTLPGGPVLLPAPIPHEVTPSYDTDPHATVHRKYLNLNPGEFISAHLPKAPNPRPRPAIEMEQITFTDLASFSESSSFQIPQTNSSDIYIEASRFRHISCQENEIDVNDKVMFIFAGRAGQEGCMVPQLKLEEDARIILVVTPEQYRLLPQSSLMTMDVLIIDELNSQLCGDYTPVRGSITARRIAAFLFAAHLNLQYCIFADDNLSNIRFTMPSDGLVDAKGSFNLWNHLFSTMKEQAISNNAACISIETENRFKRPNENKNRIGWKFFFLQCDLVNRALKDDPEIAYLLFPHSMHTSRWGEDFVWQYMMNELMRENATAEQTYSGFCVLSTDVSVLRRSTINQSLAARNTEKYDTYLGSLPTDPDILFPIEKWSDYGVDLRNAHVARHRQCVAWMNELMTKSTENLIRHGLFLKSADLHRAHYRANRMQQDDLTNPQSPATPLVKGPYRNLSSQETILELAKLYKEKNDFFIQAATKNAADKNSFYDYQIETISSILSIGENKEPITLENIDAFQNKVQVSIGTGGGKSVILITLAHLMYQLRINKPIFIVVPTLDLVSQMYQGFKKWNSKFATENGLTMRMKNVIKVCSGTENISAKLFKYNASIHDGSPVVICCFNSFMQFVNETQRTPEATSNMSLVNGTSPIPTANTNALSHIKPSIILLDEEHLIKKEVMDKIIHFGQMGETKCYEPNSQSTSLLVAVTATPKECRKDFRQATRISRLELVHRGTVAPLVVSLVPDELFEDKKVCPKKLADYLLTLKHPEGFPVIDKPMLIKFKTGTDLKPIEAELRRRGLKPYIIAQGKKGEKSLSKETKNNIQAFLNDPNGIALVKKMLNIGFDFTNLRTTIAAINGVEPNNLLTLQFTNRSTRVDAKNKKVVGYTIIPREHWESAELDILDGFTPPDDQKILEKYGFCHSDIALNELNPELYPALVEPPCSNIAPSDIVATTQSQSAPAQVSMIADNAQVKENANEPPQPTTKIIYTSERGREIKPDGTIDEMCIKFIERYTKHPDGSAFTDRIDVPATWAKSKDLITQLDEYENDKRQELLASLFTTFTKLKEQQEMEKLKSTAKEKSARNGKHSASVSQIGAFSTRASNSSSSASAIIAPSINPDEAAAKRRKQMQ